jgi:Protein of unknown function (DUF1573)
MKRFLIVSLLFVTGFSAYSQTNAVTPVVKTEILSMKETQHDFGKIPQGRPVTYEFSLTNIGKEDLVLENVQASCGCTTPVWKKEPVSPGANSNITVGYNAAAEGPFEKTVNISYNGGQMKTLVIKGTVNKAATASAPANPSIQLLKQVNQ